MSTEPHWSAPHPSGAPHPHPPHGYGPYSDPFAYRFYRSHSRLRGGWPRRVIWFGLGATAAVLYTRKHDSHSGEREKAWGDRWRRDTPPLADAPITSLATPVRNWDEEIEKVALLKRQAGHAAADISEAGLDSILSTVTALKMKLSEERARKAAAINVTGPSKQGEEFGWLV